MCIVIYGWLNFYHEDHSDVTACLVRPYKPTCPLEQFTNATALKTRIVKWCGYMQDTGINLKESAYSVTKICVLFVNRGDNVTL